MLWALEGVYLGSAPLRKVAWPYIVEAGTSSYRAHPLVGQAPGLPMTKPLRSCRGLILSQLEGRQKFEGGGKQRRQKLADK